MLITKKNLAVNMALKNGKINVLNALGQRKVSFPAHHFSYICIPKYNPVLLSSLDDWIYQNLNSRYYIGQSIDLIDNSVIYTTKLGFEQEKELSFFRLACPYLP
jgi:hypothetical protein